MLWFCRQDSRAFRFCSHWDQIVKMKSFLHSKQRKTFTKNVHQASTPLFPVPGWGTPGACLDKVHWNKPRFASHQQALHSLHSSPLAAAGASLVGTGGCMQSGCESPPMPTEKGVSRLYASVTEHTAGPLRTSKHLKVQIQFISVYISTWTPQSCSHLSSSGELKHSRQL